MTTSEEEEEDWLHFVSVTLCVCSDTRGVGIVSVFMFGFGLAELSWVSLHLTRISVSAFSACDLCPWVHSLLFRSGGGGGSSVTDLWPFITFHLPYRQCSHLSVLTFSRLVWGAESWVDADVDVLAGNSRERFSFSKLVFLSFSPLFEQCVHTVLYFVCNAEQLAAKQVCVFWTHSRWIEES